MSSCHFPAQVDAKGVQGKRHLTENCKTLWDRKEIYLLFTVAMLMMFVGHMIMIADLKGL